MELSANNFLLFTDGIDVGVIKCTGSANSVVNLNGTIYLPGIGSDFDPVLSVNWHPTNPHSFVTVRANAGWTLWDVVRLQTKNTAPTPATDLLDSVAGLAIPSLFRGYVESPWGLTEGTHPWSSASNVIAGKKLSPGVLAILKRGDASPERKSSKYEAFAFSKDGMHACAVLTDGIKAWKLGHRCSSVVPLMVKSEDDLVLKSVKAMVGIDKSDFMLISESGLNRINLSEDECSFSLVNSISIDNVSLGCIASLGSIVICGGSAQSSGVVVVLDGSRLLVCSAPQRSVSSIVSTTTVGDSRQVALYATGETGENGCMWTAQALDIDLFREKEPVTAPQGFYDESSPINEDDDFPHSDTSAGAPQRLESSVGITRTTTSVVNNKALEASFVKELSGDLSRMIEQEVVTPLKDRLSRQQREFQSASDKEAKRLETAITRVIKEQFSNALSRVFQEVSDQIESKVNAKMESVRIQTPDNHQLVRKLDDLIARTEAVMQSIGSSVVSSGAPEPAALGEIRRYINAGDHLQAISTATQWWKLNHASDQSDLLAITCAAIAPQIKPGEPLRDIVTGCYMLLVLTEWTAENSSAHADRTVAVLRAARFVISCLFVSPITISGDTMDLCYKSLAKSVRNAAGILGTGDRNVDDLSRQVLSEVRELMLKFTTSSRASTPRTSISASPGTNILHLLQSGNRRHN
jgi:gas vesicle protein